MDPLDILDSAENGGEGGRVLQVGVHRCSESDTRRPSIPNHFQSGGGCGSASLGVGDGGGSGKAGQAWTIE